MGIVSSQHAPPVEAYLRDAARGQLADRMHAVLAAASHSGTAVVLAVAPWLLRKGGWNAVFLVLRGPVAAAAASLGVFLMLESRRIEQTERARREILHGLLDPLQPAGFPMGMRQQHRQPRQQPTT